MEGKLLLAQLLHKKFFLFESQNSLPHSKHFCHCISSKIWTDNIQCYIVPSDLPLDLSKDNIQCYIVPPDLPLDLSNSLSLSGLETKVLYALFIYHMRNTCQDPPFLLDLDKIICVGNLYIC